MIRTSGDRIQDRPLAEAGGKGLFTKEIDAALLSGEIDAAVHSAKDLPSLLPPGVAIAACLAARGRTRRARLGLRRHGRGPAAGGDLRRRFAPPPGPGAAPEARPQARIFARQCRDAAQEGRGWRDRRDPARARGPQAARPRQRARAVLELDKFLPAPGQGAIAIAARSADARALRALEPISDAATSAELMAERAFLAELEGSCRTPIAGLARLEAGRLRFRGEVLRADGSERFDIAAEGASGDAEPARAGRRTRTQSPPARRGAGGERLSADCRTNLVFLSISKAKSNLSKPAKPRPRPSKIIQGKGLDFLGLSCPN